MSKDKSFGYKDAARYIGNKWVAELWQKKYIIIPTIFFAYVSGASGEDKDDREEIAKQIFNNPMASLLASGVTRCSDDLFKCKQFIAGQRDTIREQATLIEFMNQGLKRLCDIIVSASVSDHNYEELCNFVNNRTIDLLGVQYKQIDLMHDEL